MVKVILVAATLWEHSCFYLLYFFLDLEQVSSDKFVGFLFGENDEDFFLVWQSLSYKRSVCWFNRNTKTEYTGFILYQPPIVLKIEVLSSHPTAKFFSSIACCLILEYWLPI